MNKNIKRLIVILVLIILFIILIMGLRIGAQFLYFSRTLPVKENFIETYDNRFCYVQLSSPKKKICTLYICENTQFGGQSYTDFKCILPNQSFSDKDMKFISWGKNTYDLFFYSLDTGNFCYKFFEEGWEGPYHVEKSGEEYILRAEDLSYIEIDNSTIPDKFFEFIN